MRTPQRVTSVELAFEIQTWLSDNVVCKKCNGKLSWQKVSFSMHSVEFAGACAGPGKVETLNIPYCNNCEANPPDEHGCIHLPYFSIR